MYSFFIVNSSEAHAESECSSLRSWEFQIESDICHCKGLVARHINIDIHISDRRVPGMYED